MSAGLLLLAPAVLAGAGLVAIVLHGRPRVAAGAAVVGCAVGAALSLAAALPVLAGRARASEIVFRDSPFGAVSFGLDGVSALFLMIIATLSVPAAVFGTGYLAGHAEPRRVGIAHGLLALLVASTCLVVSARNAAGFLVAWEAMTVTTYFLVVFDSASAECRKAGFRYLVASQLAAACALAFFGVLSARAGSLEFVDLARAASELTPSARWMLFLAAVAGFGTKAGLVPFHVWLPRAHPVAPSHVSALMSGVLLKIGVYGLVRALLLLGPPSAGFGLLLLVAGSVGGVVGIANAVVQRDLKRSLAYSSIENVGIVVVGLGLSQMAAAHGATEIASLAAAGACLHLVHHMLMKGLLFLGAGAVVHATGERDVERLGGLMKRMPWTGGAFVTGAAAISALPPFCGFVGEWLILTAAFRAVGVLPVAESAAVAASILALLFSSGLAAAAFTRLVGVTFLGEPRSDAAGRALEPGWTMRGPLVFLAALCLVPGLFPGAATRVVAAASGMLTGDPAAAVTAATPAVQAAARIGAVAMVLVLVIVAVAIIRRVCARPDAAARVATWGCGYSQPSARMQYTATSFGAPLAEVVGAVTGGPDVVRPSDAPFVRDVRRPPPKGDRIEERVFEPVFSVAVRFCAAVRARQDGRIGGYILQVVLALVAAVIWAVASTTVLA